MKSCRSSYFSTTAFLCSKGDWSRKQHPFACTHCNISLNDNTGRNPTVGSGHVVNTDHCFRSCAILSITHPNLY